MTFVDMQKMNMIAIFAVYQQEIASYQQQLWMFGWKNHSILVQNHKKNCGFLFEKGLIKLPEGKIRFFFVVSSNHQWCNKCFRCSNQASPASLGLMRINRGMQIQRFST